MAAIQKPTDVYVTNGWYIDIPSAGIGVDGLFETLSGLEKNSGVVEVVDAGTNKKYKFTDQMQNFGNITLTRSYNGSSADRAMTALVDTMISTGVQLPTVVVYKLHHGKEVMCYVIENFAFHSIQLPEFNVAGTDKFVATYEAHCSGWEEIPV